MKLVRVMRQEISMSRSFQTYIAAGGAMETNLYKQEAEDELKSSLQVKIYN